jgi:neutral amino acid transport system ATP-binding protein
LTSQAILQVRDVVKRFGGIAAVDGASFDVERGSITALIGPNGAGKTTVFNLIAGAHRAERGSVSFDDVRIDNRPPYAVARAGLVRTFQHARAMRRMSVLDNVMLAAPGQPGERLRRILLTPRSVRQAEDRVRTEAHELLALVKLDELADEYAGALSGGQRKLLEFARALMCRPRMIMLDEPMAGVNPTLGRDLLIHMCKLREARDLTFLMIEHDLDAVMSVSDRVLVMNEGRVIASGSPEEVRADERVIDAYLGAHYGPAPASDRSGSPA